MNDQTDHDCDGLGENGHSLPPPSQNTTDHNLHNDETSRSCLDCNSSNSDLSQKCNYNVKYIDYQPMLTGQGSAAMNLKMPEYKKADSENTTLHTNMMNFINDNRVTIGQYNIMDTKTKSVSNAIYLNSRFTNISECFNTLGDTVDNATTGQKYVKQLVSQTINAFQEQILNISDNIEGLLKQVNVEKIKAKEELYILENKYSLDLIVWKTNSEQFTNEINNLKSEIVILLEKLIEKNMMLLNKENDMALNSKEDQNALVINQNKSMNSKYDGIQFENQSLRHEIIIMKNSLGENKNNLDDQLNKSRDRTKLSDMFKEDSRIFFLESLEERNKYLETINTGLMDCCIGSKEISMDTVQEEKENNLRNMRESYECLIKMQEEKLMDLSQQLNLQREKENKINNELLDLKQEIKTCNSTIVSLQDEGKAKNILITELKNKNDDLNKNLSETNIKLRDSSDDLLMAKNTFEKEKTALERQSQEYLKQINELTMNYMKYKKKAKQLNVEVLKLRNQLSHLEQKKTQLPSPEIIEILSDSEENNIVDIISDIESNIEDNYVCIHKLNDQNGLDVSMCSSSSRINENSNRSNIKRNSSFVKPVDKSIIKKCRTADNPASLQEKTSSAKIQKQNSQQISPVTHTVLSSKQKVQQPKDATTK